MHQSLPLSHPPSLPSFSFLLPSFCVLGMEPRASHMPGKLFTNTSSPVSDIEDQVMAWTIRN